MTKDTLKGFLKPNQKLVDTKHEQIGTDEIGFPIFKLIYIDAPINYKLIRTFEHLECAILEDLDYVEVVQDEPTNEA